MDRPLRHAPGGLVYHGFNRANASLPIFHKEGDYEAFERILAEALEHVPGMIARRCNELSRTAAKAGWSKPGRR